MIDGCDMAKLALNTMLFNKRIYLKANQRKQYAEEFGLAFEQFGITRMAGRILGWLLVCEPPHQSPQDLQDALQASKGSISTNIRMLERLNFVERISLPGDRRTYFRSRQTPGPAS